MLFHSFSCGRSSQFLWRRHETAMGIARSWFCSQRDWMGGLLLNIAIVSGECE
jgi:hypothetical protein